MTVVIDKVGRLVFPKEIRDQLGPDTELEIIEKNIYSNFKIILSEEKDYKEVISQISSLGLSDGIVYDLFHYICARPAKANTILTYNERDFQKISVLLPEDF